MRTLSLLFDDVMKILPKLGAEQIFFSFFLLLFDKIHPHLIKTPEDVGEFTYSRCWMEKEKTVAQV